MIIWGAQCKVIIGLFFIIIRPIKHIGFVISIRNGPQFSVRVKFLFYFLIYFWINCFVNLWVLLPTWEFSSTRMDSGTATLAAIFNLPETWLDFGCKAQARCWYCSTLPEIYDGNQCKGGWNDWLDTRTSSSMDQTWWWMVVMMPDYPSHVSCNVATHWGALKVGGDLFLKIAIIWWLFNETTVYEDVKEVGVWITAVFMTWWQIQCDENDAPE